MMLEDLVSKRRDSRYRSGPSRDWIKVKNRAYPAMERAMETLSQSIGAHRTAFLAASAISEMQEAF